MSSYQEEQDDLEKKVREQIENDRLEYVKHKLEQCASLVSEDKDFDVAELHDATISSDCYYQFALEEVSRFAPERAKELLERIREEKHRINMKYLARLTRHLLPTTKEKGE